jgi:hypothetical protein
MDGDHLWLHAGTRLCRGFHDLQHDRRARGWLKALFGRRARRIQGGSRVGVQSVSVPTEPDLS